MALCTIFFIYIDFCCVMSTKGLGGGVNGFRMTK